MDIIRKKNGSRNNRKRNIEVIDAIGGILRQLVLMNELGFERNWGITPKWFLQNFKSSARTILIFDYYGAETWDK